MTTSELSRPIKLRPLPGETVSIDASEAERSALARRFALPAIEKLSAKIDLEQDGKAVRATGTLEAQIIQNCAISGDLLVHPDIASLLYDEERHGIEELEKKFEKQITITARQGFHLEQFEIIVG